MTKPKTKMLDTFDIFDFYACSFLFQRGVTEEDSLVCRMRIDEIHDMYVAAGKERIKAEAKFLGIDLGDDDAAWSISRLLGSIGDIVSNDMTAASETMMQGGGFNLMGSILKGHQAAGRDLSGIDVNQFGIGAPPPKPKPPEVDAEWFKSAEAEKGRLVNDPKWHEIATAFLAMEAATTTEEKIQTVDHLNDLQHNSFHLLIDLQTGRMLSEFDGNTSHDAALVTVNEVLDIKKNSKTPREYADRLSKDVKKLLHANRHLCRTGE